MVATVGLVPASVPSMSACGRWGNRVICDTPSEPHPVRKQFMGHRTPFTGHPAHQGDMPPCRSGKTQRPAPRNLAPRNLGHSRSGSSATARPACGCRRWRLPMRCAGRTPTGSARNLPWHRTGSSGRCRGWRPAVDRQVTRDRLLRPVQAAIPSRRSGPSRRQGPEDKSRRERGV